MKRTHKTRTGITITVERDEQGRILRAGGGGFLVPGREDELNDALDHAIARDQVIEDTIREKAKATAFSKAQQVKAQKERGSPMRDKFNEWVATLPAKPSLTDALKHTEAWNVDPRTVRRWLNPKKKTPKR